MKCPRCQHENRPGAKFCEECAAPLARTCSNCGSQLSATAKFCSECAHPVAGATPAGAPLASPRDYTPKHLAEKILTSKSALEGERKHVTVLFADLKGSMELLADRDPEEARKILDPVLERMMEAVHRYEGTVNQVMGDGIMALFGAPLAHEDHAIRACYAALQMQDSIRRYAEGVRRVEGIPIRIRVGLNSGEVVVRAIGSDLHMDYTAVGQTTHLAARMEQLAEPGTTLLTSATLALCEDFVQVKSLGPMRVKGLAEPLDAYELIGATPMRSRFHAHAARGLTKFVGRTSEMAQLGDAIDLARKGRGQVVAVVGEPGVGKSRLFWEFTHSHRTDGCLVLEAASVSYGKATTYFPVIELLRGYFQIEPRDDVRKIREKVIGKLLSLDRALEAALPALLAILDVPVEDQEWTRLDPPQRRLRTLDAVKRLLLRESHVQPLVVIFEDLHWIDGETQAVLERLIESLPTAPMLLLVNYRPEYQHLWGSKTYYRQLRLDALPTAGAEELLEAQLGSDPSLAALKRLLITRTEGNPFFLEESVRTLIETKVLAGERGGHRLTRAPESLQIPPTAQAILAARIDRLLPEDKRLLQAAAVVGKDVPFALLQATADDPDVSLHEGLARLQGAEFLYETQLFPEVEYTFKHALTHEIAYAGITNDRRRALHAKIVGALESRPVDRVGEHITNLASHSLRAEMWEKAVEYLRGAAERASFRAANREAVTRLEEALGAIGRLPQTAAVLERTFELKILLAAALHPLGDQHTRGRILRDAESIAQSLGDERRLAQTWTTIGQHLWVVGTSVDDASAQVQKALEVAKRLDDVQLQIMVNHHLGGICLSQGSYVEAKRVLRNGLGLLQGRDETKHRGHVGFPAALSRSWLAWALAERGEFQEGEQVGREGLSIARALNHAYSALNATAGLATLLTVKGVFTEAIELLEEARKTAIEHGHGLWIPTYSRLLGYCYAHSGMTSQALRALADLPAMRVLQSQWLIYRGEAYLFNHRLHEAKADARDALSVARERGERGYEAYAQCLAGQIASYPNQPDVETAEREYRSAMALAEPRGMRPLVAHCHLGLGKLYGRTREREQAQEHLTTATRMYQEMGMTYWVEKAEAKQGS